MTYGANALPNIRRIDISTHTHTRFIARAIIQHTESRDWVLVGMSPDLKRSIASVLRRFGYDVVSCRARGRANIADSIKKLPRENIFYDSSGYGHERLKGYRDLVKPSWRDMFLPEPDVSSVKLNVDGAVRQAQTMNEFLRKFGFDVAGKDILEVGCHDGRNAYAMANLGARHVDAIDIPVYGVLQGKGGEPDARSLERQSRRLLELRTRSAKSFRDDTVAERVDFFDLDVANLDKENAYDLIVSWETLEHITNPREAIANMFRALRPGGMSFHEYNSFYSLEGGHSLCTLDFPYGHARLSAADFECYIQKYRPQELGVSMNFYNHCLNRMTIRDLRDFCSDVGFDIQALCTWEDEGDLAIIDRDILAQCKKLKENITFSDLISPRIWILVQKPDS